MTIKEKVLLSKAIQAGRCTSDVQITKFAKGYEIATEQVIAYLRSRIALSFSPDELASVLDGIERGEHVK